MATKNRRVAAYLPPNVDEKFKAFKVEHGLATEEDLTQNDSQALIQILSEYFGVSREVAYSLPLDLASRLENLEQKVAHLSAAIDERFENLKVEVDSAQHSSAEIRDELLGELDSRLSQSIAAHSDQLDLLVQDDSVYKEIDGSPNNLSSELPGEHEAVGPMSGPELTERFGLSGNAVNTMKHQYKNSPKKFERWTRSKDPENLAWEFRGGKYWPKSISSDLPSES